MVPKEDTGFLRLGTKIFSPYSPNFNPIERIWNTIKIRWFNNYVCRDLQQLINRLDQVILDVIDNPKRIQKNGFNRNANMRTPIKEKGEIVLVVKIQMDHGEPLYSGVR